MNNPTKKPIQPIPPKQTNPAVDELVALRQEMSEFRNDFAKFNHGKKRLRQARRSLGLGQGDRIFVESYLS